MKTTNSSTFLVALCIVGCLLTVPDPVQGTDLHEYKSGETLVIDHGIAPDRQLAIAAGITGKGDSRRFRLFLVDGKSKARIGPLEEFGGALDTGAESIIAAWAPDSRHVTITYRVDRQVTETLVYRVENRRAYPVTGPLDVLSAVESSKVLDDAQRTTDSRTVKWLSATRFILRQHSQFHRLGQNLPAALKNYGELTGDDDGPADKSSGPRRYSFDFYGDGICELLLGDKFHFESVKPTPISVR